MHDLTDAVNVGVGFCVNKARIAVACVAADALRCDRIRGVSLQTKWDGKWMVAEFPDVVLNLLHAGLVGQCWKRIGFGVKWLGEVRAAEVFVEITVGTEELLSTAVV